MEYEKAYVFRAEDERPAKRQRTEAQGLHTSWKTRRQAYQTVWQTQKEAIDTKLAQIDDATVDELSTFLGHAVQTPYVDRIPTGIILQGADGGCTALTQLTKRLDSAKRRLVVLSSSTGSNLKAILKTLVQKATRADIGVDEDETEDSHRSRPNATKLLNYDLQILHNFVIEKGIEQVIVTFEDTEAFNLEILSEVIELLSCWVDRIPLVCLFNIATDVDALQRLSKTAIKCLDGKLFDVAPSGDAVEQVVEALVTSGSPLWLGAGLLGMALERQKDYIQSIGSLVDSVQYAFMSAYYANALTVFLVQPRKEEVTGDYAEALRALASFHAFAEDLLKRRETGRLRELFNDDKQVYQLAIHHIEEGQRALRRMIVAVRVIRTMQQNLPQTATSSLSNLYTQAMSGRLPGSTLLRSLLLLAKKVPSDVSVALLEAVLEVEGFGTVAETSRPLLDQLRDLISQQKDTAQLLRSEDDVKNATLRTTVVAQKVELSKQKSALSEQDKAYTSLLAKIASMFEQYFNESIVDPKTLLFHEIFIYDQKSPYREVFTPRPRHAIERALASPHDYLDCDCCAPDRDGEEATLSSTQPPTAILYQLYLESGNLINASDLWQAFQAVIGDEKEEAEAMALFQRGLAELRSLGMMKPTRKRVDHVAKVLWRGL
ncbi:hypothetical protein LTR62_006513 [Meristemomyces frigidus]|uniref:Origin recognition complex subunit 3 n=1 Tax=Meristemomyces frigidus TaxID=1508187 RepID=A0AAN7YED7_9PEZI|nr:hypothetical protein LTR62_006513 [Meristemomyces frigidus]